MKGFIEFDATYNGLTLHKIMIRLDNIVGITELRGDNRTLLFTIDGSQHALCISYNETIKKIEEALKNGL